MDKQYYVQVIAENYLKNIVDDPVSMQIHTRFLQGLEPEEFREGYLALLALARSLCEDIIRDPGRFGMKLIKNIEYNSKSTDYTSSNISFSRVPNLMFLLGAVGERQGDSSLLLSGAAASAAAKDLKITGLPQLLAVLGDYGFVTEGIGKAIKAEDKLAVSYPDNSALLVALKALAEAQLELNKGDLKKSKNYFYMQHPGLLENEVVKAPKLTVDAVYHALNPANRQAAASLHEAVADYAKHVLRMGGFMRNDWSCVYTGKKSKKVIMSLQVEQEDLSAKLNLANIGSYMSLVDKQPESVRQAIRESGWDCGRCNSGCAGGFAFEMDGKDYNKCRCGSFVFHDLNENKVESCKALLKQEIETANV